MFCRMDCRYTLQQIGNQIKTDKQFRQYVPVAKYLDNKFVTLNRFYRSSRMSNLYGFFVLVRHAKSPITWTTFSQIIPVGFQSNQYIGALRKSTLNLSQITRIAKFGFEQLRVVKIAQILCFRTTRMLCILTLTLCACACLVQRQS